MVDADGGSHLHLLCLGESFFPWGFGAVLSGPLPALSFFKVCHLGAWWFRGIPGGLLSFARYPLGHILIVSCRIPFPVLGGGGGGREKELLSIIIMHSCNPNDRLDLLLYSHCWANVNLCFRRLHRSSYVGLGV